MQLSDFQYENSFIANLKQIIQQARQKAYSAINFAQVEAHWLLGQRIVEQEQNGAERAEYGKYVIKIASQELTKEFGKGFSERTLRQFRQFYLMFPEFSIRRTVLAESSGEKLLLEKNSKKSDNEINTNLAITDRQISEPNLHLLSWTHIQRIMRVENSDARIWYLKEASEQMWAVRTLIARYSILKGNEQLFATKYKLFLPTTEELNAEIERQKEIFKLQYEE
jgi:hypothetical protein